MLTLGVVGESGSGVVEGVDDGEGHGTSETTGGDVGGELEGVAGVLGGGEESLDLSLEGEVEGLGGEVSEKTVSLSQKEFELTGGRWQGFLARRIRHLQKPWFVGCSQRYRCIVGQGRPA